LSAPAIDRIFQTRSRKYWLIGNGSVERQEEAVTTLSRRWAVGSLIPLALSGLAIAARGPASAAQGPPQVTVTIGVLDFQDDSDAGIAGLGSGVARLLRQRLSSQHRDAVTKLVAGGAEAAGGPPTVEQLQALGQRYGVRYIVHGGVLPVEPAPREGASSFTISLYADLVALETGQAQTFRVDGVATLPSPDLAPAKPKETDVASPAFAATPAGQALGDAVARLADTIYLAITTPASLAPAMPEAAAPAAAPDPTAGAAAAPSPQELDLEIQQLVADAQNAIANYGGFAPQQAEQLRAALERLNAALAQKADQLTRGEDTQATDQSILQAKELVRASLDALMQAAMNAQSGQALQQSGQSGTPSEGVMSRVNAFTDQTLSLVQKIQELRALLGGASQEAEASGYAGDPSAAQPPVEQAPGSVTGVVVEDGQPVIGAEVTETSTGASTTTGADGSYTLAPLPPGVLTVLNVRRQGRLLATGQVHVLAARVNLADFQLRKTGTTGVRPGVLGSASARRVAASAGSISGRVVDAGGQPVARALVSVPGAGIVRTNSRGEFAMSGVPAGAYSVSARDTAKGAATTAIKVAAASPTIVTVRLAAVAVARPLPATTPTLLVTGRESATVSGRIRDQQNRDLGGVRISLLRAGAAVSVLTNASGRYLVRGLGPGEYQLVAARPGFETATRSVALKARDDKGVDLKLEQLTAMVDTMRRAEAVRRAAVAHPEKPRTGADATKATYVPRPATPAPRVVQRGQIQGRVVDAQTHKPVAGARITTTGGRSAVTDRNGSFRIEDLAAGAVAVHVARPGYVGQERSLSVAAGRTATADFALHMAPRPKR
jgi:hypothetical protein